jgi:hypothetical protein
MKAIKVVGGVVLVLVLVAMCAETDEATTTASNEASSEAVAEWREVKRWEGKGIKDTETFTVPRNWRIRWESRDDNSVFQIYAYRDRDDAFPSVAANMLGAGSDTSYQRGAGDHYLTINPTGRWTVIVEAR